jgi:hypothetical protein
MALVSSMPVLVGRQSGFEKRRLFLSQFTNIKREKVRHRLPNFRSSTDDVLLTMCEFQNGRTADINHLATFAFRLVRTVRRSIVFDP